MSIFATFRERFMRAIPIWLTDRVDHREDEPALVNIGFEVLWSLIAPLDAYAEGLRQGLIAPWPGIGTPTALPLIGRTRGILRGYGVSETEDHYVGRLLGWLDTHAEAGSQLAICKQLHEYISNRPRVRCVNRAGQWTTVNADGSVTRAQQDLNWDSVSNPERSGNWSDQWIFVWPDPWPHAASRNTGGLVGRRTGIGHDATPEEFDAVNAILAQVKGAESRVRAIVWTTDATLFDPANPASMPDGTWGQWSVGGSGSRVRSGRDVSTCRFWEPN